MGYSRLDTPTFSAQAPALQAWTFASSDFGSQVAAARPRLYSAALALTGNSADADDLVQEVVLRALRFSHGFQPGTNLMAWLRTILRNTSVNVFRRSRVRPSAAGSEDGVASIELAPAPPASPDHVTPEEFRAARDAFSAEVHDAVMELPDHYRTVFLLAALGDLKYREIADRTGVPVGTVMSRLSRARALLRARLR